MTKQRDENKNTTNEKIPKSTTCDNNCRWFEGANTVCDKHLKLAQKEKKALEKEARKKQKRIQRIVDMIRESTVMTCTCCICDTECPEIDTTCSNISCPHHTNYF